MTAQHTLPYPQCDLRAHPPRGPHEQLAGLVFLPRTIDKVRAKLQGTLGLYRVAPGISGYLFEWLGITEEQFTDVVRNAKDDAAIADWIRSHCDPGTFGEINERLRLRGIRDEQHRLEVLPRYPVLEEYPALRNWFEIFELDDRWTFDPANAEKVRLAASS
ncbi:MAG TPA: DUF5069 domain-containing protein [Candidatus Limnocylindria bacterium]|jgi:hypothetical protein|nr:DUF5069 domain-containing protein [Candidatus Limnocylindria bacterium]